MPRLLDLHRVRFKLKPGHASGMLDPTEKHTYKIWLHLIICSFLSIRYFRYFSFNQFYQRISVSELPCIIVDKFDLIVYCSDIQRTTLHDE